MNLDKKEVAITRRNLGQVSNKNLYIIRNNGIVYQEFPRVYVSFRDERKKFLILLSFTKPVYKTINHRTSFLAPARDFFQLIKHVYVRPDYH